jgi:hypothetical protein
MHTERKPPTTPPCESCRVELMVDNEDAARIFQTTRAQCLTRFNGESDVVIDLNHVAVWAAIDAYGVRDRTGCFERVIRVFHHFLHEKREG